jgi:hypothetical protein
MPLSQTFQVQDIIPGHRFRIILQQTAGLGLQMLLMDSLLIKAQQHLQ